MSDKRLDFLNEAASRIGTGPEWVWSTAGGSRGDAWCAETIVAVGNTVGGVIGTVIYKSFMAGEMVQMSVQSGMGTYQKGGHNGGNPSPAAGDLILYNRGNATSGSGDFAGNHIGIVYKVEGTKVTTIEGNSGSGDTYTRKICTHEREAGQSDIACFYRPNWEKAGGSSTGNPSGEMGSTVTAGGDLYDTITTRADSIIREVGYLDSSNKLSTSSSNLRCSVINYTTQLGSFFKGAIGTGETSSSGTGSFTGTMSGGTNFEQVFNYMVQNGYTKQAAAAACGNLGGEGGVSSSGDLVINSTEKGSGSGIGIVQWSYGRKTSFKNYASSVGDPWPGTSLKTQVQFMMMELEGIGTAQCWTWPQYSGKKAWPTQYKGYTAQQYKSSTDLTLATWLFCIYFESPYYYNSNISRRIEIANQVYNSYA